MMGFKLRTRLVALLFVFSMTGGVMTAVAADAPKWVAIIFVQAQKAVGLRWNVVPGTTEYKILRSTTAGSDYQEIASVTAPQYFDKTIEPGNTYYYVLQAVAAGAASPNSEERSVVIPGEKKEKAVQSPEWENVNYSSSKEFGKMIYKVGLFWKKNPSPNVVAYNVYKSTTAGKDYALATSTQDTKIIDDKVEEGKTYYYVLTALDNQFQETAFSEEKSVTIEKPKAAPERKKRKKYPKMVPIPTETVDEMALPNYPIDIAMGKEGTIYVSSGTLYMVDSFGGDLEEMNYPNIGGLGIGLENELLACDQVGKEVFVIEGSQLRRFSIPRLDEPLLNPQDGETPLAIKDPTPFDVTQNIDGKYWVSDNPNNRVAIFDEDFAFLRNAGEVGVSDVIPNTGSIDHDSQGNVFVVSGSNNAVYIFDKDGNFISRFGETGNVASTFSRIKGLAVDKADAVYVVDGITASIQKFDNTGKFLGAFSSADKKAGPGFSTPNAVSLSPDMKTALVSESLTKKLKQVRILE